jgi:polysaccharide export outer membrane protein
MLLLCVCALGVTGLCGCGDKFWDPTQVGRFRPVPAVNVILDSLGVAEENPAAWEMGEEPKPVDVISYDTDYVFGSGDVVAVNVFELFNESTMFSNQFIITETGKLSIPEVGVVQAAGLTESQLEEEIKQILAPNILKEPSVNVTLVQSQSQLFSILGNGIPRSGRYPIPRYDFRLTDALASAGGISQFNISYIYVSRPISGREEVTTEAAPAGPKEVYQPPVSPTTPTEPNTQPSEPANKQQEELMEVIAPIAKRANHPLTSPGADKDNTVVIASTEMITDEELSSTNNPAAHPSNSSPETNVADKARIEWIFQDGRWTPVRIGEVTPEKPVAAPTKPGAAAPGPEKVAKEPTITVWDQIGAGGSQRRVIRVPADKLLSGAPRYNIVIRPGDNIHVPVDIVGEFCIMGNVNAQGFINITGRPMTLKMAIAAAGGLGPLAWPKRCEVVRRIGKKREEIVMVDLDKISAGEQPDFFIKPNDLINVGTHPTARFRAVLRNAFRATYGFGFIYDRNFADRDFGTGRPFDFLEF